MTDVSRRTCVTSRGRAWPQELVDELLRLRATHTGEAIAELLGVSHAALRKKVSRLKIGNRYHKPLKWRTRDAG
jgi:hypothetical protein